MQAAAVAVPSGMTGVLGLDEAAINELCARVATAGRLWKANLLGPGNTVVSGERRALDLVEQVATELGASRVIPLAVAGAFHSPIMQAGADSLDEVLAGVDFRPPRIPVYSNVDAAPHDDPAGIRPRLIAQVIGEVRWEQSMRRMLADGFDTFYEVGPGRVLTGLLKRIDRKTPCTSVPAR
jgi:[acyl-carrier-protein] S-malonyltransferase